MLRLEQAEICAKPVSLSVWLRNYDTWKRVRRVENVLLKQRFNLFTERTKDTNDMTKRK